MHHGAGQNLRNPKGNVRKNSKGILAQDFGLDLVLDLDLGLGLDLGVGELET